MAKQLYNDAMMRSHRGAFTSAKIDCGETVDDLSERLQNLAVGLPELENAAGDTILLQRFTCSAARTNLVVVVMSTITVVC
jgi:hypothetical protein